MNFKRKNQVMGQSFCKIVVDLEKKRMKKIIYTNCHLTALLQKRNYKQFECSRCFYAMFEISGNYHFS